MKLTLTIEMLNDAFVHVSGKTGHAEVASILRGLADRLPTYANPTQAWTLFDANGNKVGKAEVIE